jgi:thiamine biosynthesis lipoprotein
MGTDALLVVHTGRRTQAVDSFSAVERRARDLERLFTRFDDTSELSRLNAANGRWLDVSNEMATVLELAIGMHHQTVGLFDPSVLPDLERAGYDRSFELITTAPSTARRARPALALDDIAFRNGAVRLPRGMRLDLGGIVKGWAAEVLVDMLAPLGPALVSLGGDTAVRGIPPDGAWRIGVQRPAHNTLLAVIRLGAGGVATSGTDRRRWRTTDGWAHHLIDPRTRAPSDSDLLQVTAVAATATYAEAWAKAALLAGSEGAGQLLAAHPEVRVILVPHIGAPSASTGLSFETEAAA